MTWCLKGRHVVVTGASSALGSAVVAELARCAVSSIVAAGRNEARLQLLRSSTTETVVHPFVTDLVTPGAAKELANFSSSLCEGNVALVVQCTGINKDNLLVRTSEVSMSETLKLNLETPLVVTKEFLRSSKMLKVKDGGFCYVGSVVAEKGNVGQAIYGASKAGLEGAVRSLAREYGANNIRFNVVAPGLIQGAGMGGNLTEAQREAFVKGTSLKRAAEVQEVASSIVAVSRMTYLTGSTIPLNGGS